MPPSDFPLLLDGVVLPLLPDGVVLPGRVEGVERDGEGLFELWGAGDAGEAPTHLLFVLQTPYAIFFAVPSTSSTHGSPALSP